MILKLGEFLNRFGKITILIKIEKTTSTKLLQLNEKLDKLEKKMSYIESGKLFYYL
jgi:hypothetical protein